MSLCINPNCQNPDNPNDLVNCASCSSELLLQARYRVIQKLGRGGFGITFEINEVRTNIRKVLKVLIQNDDPQAIQLFKQEADVFRKLNNPGITQLDDYFVYYPYQSPDAIHCLVMEKIEGINLQEYMENRNFTSIDETLAITWLKDLINILDEVHSENFLHGDIKPSNIMLRADHAQLVLINFGIVKEITTTIVNQQEGVTEVYSDGYTPPEQINFSAVPQSDFYALARTFVYLLTGKFPLDPVMYDAENEQLNWRNHAPQISSILADLLDDMMQRLVDRPENTQVILQRISDIEIALKIPQIPSRKPLISRRRFIQTASLIIGSMTLAIVGNKLLFTYKKNRAFSNLKTFNFEIITTNSSGNITNRRNTSAKYFTENLGNGVTLDMVKIPGGTFIMGSPPSERDRNSSESPQHQVTVPGFFMAKCLLTQKQYQAIIGTNPATFKGDNRPVENVSWEDAVAFCEKLSQKTGLNYTLPSEAQWEYACRAGTTTPFYFGENITPDLVNYNSNYPYGNGPQGQYRQQTTDVGIFPPNAFGLYDMHGNLWEWCLDDYEKTYNNAPKDGSALISPIAKYKVLRGGSWYLGAKYSRSAHRGRFLPTYRFNLIGFRVVVLSGSH